MQAGIPLLNLHHCIPISELSLKNVALFWRKCLFWGIRISMMKNYVDRAARNVDRDQSSAAYCAILPQRFMECVYWSLLYKSLSVQETTLHSCLEYELIWKKKQRNLDLLRPWKKASICTSKFNAIEVLSLYPFSPISSCWK